MTLAQYWRVLAKHWLLALLPIVLLVGGALVWSEQTTPVYTARASAWFTLPVGESGSDLYQGANYTQTQLGSYAQLATKPIVLTPVIESLGLDTTARKLAGNVSATVVPKSVVIQFTATSSDPQRAASIANAVTGEVAKAAEDLAPTLGNGDPAVSTKVVAAATPPKFASSPETLRNVLAAGLLGLFLGLILPVVREVLDPKVRTARDLPAGLPVLATIPRVGSLPWAGRGRRRSQRPDFLVTESLRKVQASLQVVGAEHPVKVIALSSSVASEGTTSLSIQLARLLAEGSRDVLLIDGDLRRPDLAKLLSLEDGVGFTDVLAGSVPLDQALQRGPTPRLHVLTAGGAVPSPADALGGPAMSTLVGTLRDRYDYVVITTPPLVPVADALVVATHADGVLLVARYGKATNAQVASSLEQLNRVGARVLGAVLNATPRPSRWRTRSSYYDSRRVRAKASASA